MKCKVALTLMVLVCFFFTNSLFSQVGVGTTNPTSELEIATTNSGIPALELNPQINPTGTVTGQIAVIGDKLYMYDAVRGKWLTTETTALQFGWEGTTNNSINLWFGGDLRNNNSGPLMPFNGTIVGVTVKSGGGSATKRFRLRRNGNNIAGITGRLDLTGGVLNDMLRNVDFNAGDYLSIRPVGAGTANDIAAVIWVKWRQ